MRKSRFSAAIAAVCATACLMAAAGSSRAAPRLAAQAGGSPAQVVMPAGSQPQALAVAQARSGAAAMAHQLMVLVRGWQRGTGTCVSAITDTRAAPPNPGGCATPKLTAPLPSGYSTAQLRSYLHLNGDGSGQTIAIVDAFDNPDAASDLTAFSKEFGLPVPCGTPAAAGCFPFSVVQPSGTAGADPGWALESDLDVQLAHAIAPRASIILVEAYDNTDMSLFGAIDYAAGLHASVISNSYGGQEYAGEAQDDAHCDLPASLCVVATGDSGNPGGYPAYNPYALSVGGTTLDLTSAGRKTFEVAWCCTNLGATGGGVSQYVSRPAYQDGTNPYPWRGIPDVSFDADPATGVPVLDTFGLNGEAGWFQVGGTSASTPAWSAILAVADQLRAAKGKAPLHGAGFQAQTLLYQVGRFALADVTRGVDNLFECAGLPASGCQARPGYDLTTGWGSPRPGIDTILAAA